MRLVNRVHLAWHFPPFIRAEVLEVISKVIFFSCHADPLSLHLPACHAWPPGEGKSPALWARDGLKHPVRGISPSLSLFFERAFTAATPSGVRIAQWEQVNKLPVSMGFLIPLSSLPPSPFPALNADQQKLFEQLFPHFRPSLKRKGKEN